jgi:hypothetical protein
VSAVDALSKRTRRGFPFVGLGLGGLLMLTLAFGSVGRAASTPHCQATRLHLKLRGLSAGSGHAYLDMSLRNRGPICRLRGYPRVVLVDRSGEVLRLPVGRARIRVRTVVLERGQHASFTLEYTNMGFCSPRVVVSAVRFELPGGSTPLVLHHGFSVCTPSPGAYIYPIRASAVPLDIDHNGGTFLAAAEKFSVHCGRIFWRSIRNGDQICPRFHSILSDWDWKRLRWTRWNDREALGTGLAVHQLGGPVDARDPIRIRLSRTVRCPDGRRIYTRIHATWDYGGSVGTRRYQWRYYCKARPTKGPGGGGG